MKPQDTMAAMDQSEIVASFTLGADEARRESDDRQKNAGISKTTLWLWPCFAISGFGLGVVELATNHDKVMGYLQILYACFYVSIALHQRRQIAEVPAGVETLVRFGVPGIVFERPAPQTLPWSAVEGVGRTNDALVVLFKASAIKPPLERRIVIPKRALSDGGGALWNLAEHMLLGPLRRVSAQLSADETGALRRNDAGGIGNRLARDARATIATSR